MVACTSAFVHFQLELPFLGKFGPKSKSCQFKLKLGLSGIAEYAEFSGAAYFFGFKLETHFLGKFGPKNQNYQFKLKFGT